jgi:hypothetical protein
MSDELRMITGRELLVAHGADSVGWPLVNGLGALRAWEVMAGGECYLISVAQWEEYLRLCKRRTE